MKQAERDNESDLNISALQTNVQAVCAVRVAIEGTIGPKGLDAMLVDRQGNVLVTNDGVTILEEMEANHPAAQMIVHMARTQQNLVGDGTTTATLLAAGLIEEGKEKISRGVPAIKVIEGILLGTQAALDFLLDELRTEITLDDEALMRVAMVAGREYQDIAGLVVAAARCMGQEKLCDDSFQLADMVEAEENVESEVVHGVIISRERLNREMPKSLRDVDILVIDDALEGEELDSGALATESGFKRYVEMQAEFKENMQKLIALQVGVVIADRNIGAIAEEMLADAGIIAVRRVPHEQLERVAEHTGAKVIKRTGIKKTMQELKQYLGFAAHVIEDEKLNQIRILGGRGKPMATILVSAATKEVVGERGRIAQDAAASVQAAIKGGYVAGGGAAEIAMANHVRRFREGISGMASYGVDCVAEALKIPLAQMVKNAGYNPLEKVEAVIAAQMLGQNHALGIECNHGNVENMELLGIFDPVLVKYHALHSAAEVAVSILKIDKIIRKKGEQ